MIHLHLELRRKPCPSRHRQYRRGFHHEACPSDWRDLRRLQTQSRPRRDKSPRREILSAAQPAAAVFRPSVCSQSDHASWPLEFIPHLRIVTKCIFNAKSAALNRELVQPTTITLPSHFPD